MKSQYYHCVIIFLFQLTVISIASQNDDDHIDLSLSKQKQKSIQTSNMNNATHPRMIRHEDNLERMVSSEYKACSSMPYPSISCHMNTTCVYGNQTIAVCKANVDCLGENTFAKNLTCRFCYQTEFWEYECVKKICNSAASPPTYYRYKTLDLKKNTKQFLSFSQNGNNYELYEYILTNCTVSRDVLCLGRRTFLKRLRCNWTGGHRWSTALILSITLGGFGIDRFYLGHWQEGIGKLFSFGGLGVWTLIDVLLISIRYLGPADGSLYL